MENEIKKEYSEIKIQKKMNKETILGFLICLSSFIGFFIGYFAISYIAVNYFNAPVGKYVYGYTFEYLSKVHYSERKLVLIIIAAASLIPAICIPLMVSIVNNDKSNKKYLMLFFISVVMLVSNYNVLYYMIGDIVRGNSGCSCFSDCSDDPYDLYEMDDMDG